MEAIKNFRRWLVQLNLFVDPDKTTQENEKEHHEQLLMTRIFLVLLILSLAILTVYTLLGTRSVSMTVPVSSINIYQALENKYSTKLSCPCQETSVPHSAFISITPKYHEICSSEWLSYEWLTSLYNPNITHLTPLDFRLAAIPFFRLLSSHCTYIAEAIIRINELLRKKRYTTQYLLSSTAFIDQAKKALQGFYVEVDSIMISSSTSYFIIFSIRQIKLYSALNTNAFQVTIPGSDEYATIKNMYPLHQSASTYRNSSNDFGVCSDLNTFVYQAAIYDWGLQPRHYSEIMTPQPPPIYTIPGLKVGCFPYDAIIASTLECFYSELCINETFKWISNLPKDKWPKPLNSSAHGKFKTTDTLLHILDEKMMDDWQPTHSYETYYETCAPTECTYTLQAVNGFIHLISTLLGLYGGLIVGLRTLVPILVRAFQGIYEKIFRRGSQSDDNPEQSQESIEARDQLTEGKWSQLKTMIAKAKIAVLSLNLFSSNFDNRELGIYATRIYLLLLSAGVAILATYSSFTVYSRRIIVSPVSLTSFENLQNASVESLSCPCSKVSISYDRIIQSSPIRFHQICTSGFINPAWIDDVFTIRFENGTDPISVATDDFRAGGYYYFVSVAAACGYAVQTVNLGLNVFLQNEFITTIALARNEFNQQMASLINGFQKRMTQERVFTVSLFRRTITSSSVESSIQFQTLNISGQLFLRRYSPAPPAFNVCMCSVAPFCPDTSWSGGQFICQHGNNCTAGTVIWRIPGLIKTCSSGDTLALSDLRCFYNQNCIDQMLSMLHLDLPNRSPLSPHTLTISPLDISALSNFRPDDSLGAIFDRLMIEEWTMASDFESYFNECAPSSCTYTINRRMDLAYVSTAVIGLYGGLSVTLSLLVPIIVFLANKLIFYWRQNRADSPGIITQFKMMKQRIGRMLSRLNLFKEERLKSRRIDGERIPLLATRLYVVLLLIIMVILSLFTGLTQTNTTQTVSISSIEQFERLQKKYSTTISCPCQQIAVAQGFFSSISPEYHPICSSSLITQKWIVSLYGYGPSAKHYNQLDRPLLSKYFQIIEQFCQEAKNVFIATLPEFNETTLVTTSVLSREAFDTEMRSIVGDFIGLFPMNAQRLIRFFMNMLVYNMIPTSFNTDWLLEFGDESNGYVIRQKPRLYANESCNCMISRECQTVMRVGPPDVRLPGLVTGCTPIDGLRMSTLECFYSASCIATIIAYLHYYTDVNGSSAINFTATFEQDLDILPLENINNSTFSKTTPISTLMDQLFVDKWNVTSSYEQYYLACAPSTCRYEYSSRNSVVYIITLLLSLYGGLTVGLRFFTWNAAILYLWFKRRITRTETRIQPFSNDSSI